MAGVTELFRFDPPELSDADARRIADELYGVGGDTLRLRGERSHNTRFTTADGSAYVLRVASPSEPDEAIELHADALIHLERRAPSLPVARVLASRNGQLVPAVEIGGRRHRVRLETFLPGVTFDDDQNVSPDGMRRIGELLGGVAAALADFHAPAADGFMAWDIANGKVLDPVLTAALAPDARALVDRARPRLERAMLAMASLPRQIIHNDGHAGNLLRADSTSDVVTGLIDFGDLVRTVTVADIAVCGANLVPHQDDPTTALAALTAGYAHGLAPHRELNAPELDAIPDLVVARLVLSTLLVEFQIEHAPHIADEVAAERPGTLDRLRRWLDVDPATATDRIREML
jgi:Ser/Thr protein kinase RdoA (MazF antagonist)